MQVLEGPLAHPGTADPMLLAHEPVSNTPEPRFLDMVERAKEYIRAGDIFQVVPSQRFTSPFTLPPSRFIARYGASIRRRSSVYLDFGGFRSSAQAPKFWCACATAR